MNRPVLLACGIALSAGGNVGCSEKVELAGAAADDYPFGDGGFGGDCSADSTACNNCVDDDGDGLIDGFDPECTGAADNREDSFETGIPGDNKDAVKQDCFFDGNSGAGNDGCEIHVCCLLDTCPPNLPGGVFDRAEDCPELSDKCIEVCQPLTPPGCDCFGCCTVCTDAAGCVDVLINPNTAPNCDQEELGNPDACPRCTKSAECNPGECDPDQCILCPGQTADDLPPACNGDNACPSGQSACGQSSDCDDQQFCSAGCCIGVIG